ncbi:exopolysaccharide biosynthesis polyprenyl glycosylphosphotransferase [Terriglobus saanensis]|uniref:exopolysaccharide biosynthesis polyprenyl glycosylphosphotransferase n=1 Tax=Terriglobus saanensis TaxID=870903 RepID=UPI001184B8C2
MTHPKANYFFRWRKMPVLWRSPLYTSNKSPVHSPSAKNFTGGLPSVDILTPVEQVSSKYKIARGIFPIPLAGIAWVCVTHRMSLHDLAHKWDFQFSLSRLLVLVAAFAVWNLLISLRPKSNRNESVYLREASTLAVASAACAFLVILCVGSRFRSEDKLLPLAFAMTALLGSSLIFLLIDACARHFGQLQNPEKPLVLIVGSGSKAGNAIMESARSPYSVLGCVDDTFIDDPTLKEMYLGTLDELPSLLKHHPIEAIVVTLPARSQYDQIQRAISIAENAGVDVHHSTTFFTTSIVSQSSASSVLARGTMLHAKHWDVREYIKRAIDLIVTSIALIAFSPIMLLIALAVRLTSEGPIFFVQKRYGKNRKHFPMYKFRTMVVDAEAKMKELEAKNEMSGPTFKMKHDPRVTPIGRFLRRTSLDELPQLFNVLLGNMSLVGPRPLPIRDVNLFQEGWLLRRFSVKPGLTCLWQISGRSNTTFHSWMMQDLAYIDGWSLYLDMSILLKTIPAVLKGSGAM